ncbi:unnamed protein product, partial [Choristocarpus tenellus]
MRPPQNALILSALPSPSQNPCRRLCASVIIGAQKPKFRPQAKARKKQPEKPPPGDEA